MISVQRVLNSLYYPVEPAVLVDLFLPGARHVSFSLPRFVERSLSTMIFQLMSGLLHGASTITLLDPVNSFYGPLTLLDMDSGEVDTLVPETVLAFFWAPDSRSIAYLTFNRIREENKDTEKAQLSPGLAFDTSGSNSRENRKGSDKRLSKRQPQQPRRIFLNLSVIELAGKESDLLLTFEPTHEFMGQFLPFFDQYNLSHRLWSPDSQAIVLPLQSETDEQQIVVIPVDGGKVEVVAQGSVAFWSLR